MLNWDECELLICGTHKDFEQILKRDGPISDRDVSRLREGDLILRTMDVECSPFYHAGIYCGNEEVIEFTARQPPVGAGFASFSASSSSCASSSNMEGGVSKVNVNTFIGNKAYVVLRLKKGIPTDFAEKVKAAMKSKKKYNLLFYNCLHFALELLGLTTRSLPERC